MRYHVEALLTATRACLDYPREMVETYVDLGVTQGSIHGRTSSRPARGFPVRRVSQLRSALTRLGVCAPGRRPSRRFGKCSVLAEIGPAERLQTREDLRIHPSPEGQ